MHSCSLANWWASSNKILMIIYLARMWAASQKNILEKNQLSCYMSIEKHLKKNRPQLYHQTKNFNKRLAAAI